MLFGKYTCDVQYNTLFHRSTQSLISPAYVNVLDGVSGRSAKEKNLEKD